MSKTQSKNSTSILYLTFMKVPYFAEGLMSNLSATHVSIITKLLNYNMSSFQKNKYLNPLRDIIEYKDWIDSKIRLGHHVSIIGKDVPKLVNRIKDPIKYYNTNQHKERITIWLAVVPKAEHSIQNSIETKDGGIDLQSEFLLPPIKFNAHIPNDYSVKNNNTYLNHGGYFNIYPNVIYPESKVWVSHTLYNDNGIDTMFYMAVNCTPKVSATVYLSTFEPRNISPSIMIYEKLTTEDDSSSDDSLDYELATIVGTNYINIFSDNLSIGCSINRSCSTGCSNNIKLYIYETIGPEFSNCRAVVIPLDRSDFDFLRSTNMDPNTLSPILYI